MCNTYQALNVKVNDKSYSVRVFEEQFVASSLISHATHSSDDDGGSAFEEEWVGPTFVGGGGHEFSGNFINGSDNEGSTTVRLPTEKPIESSSNNLEKGEDFNDRTENVSNALNAGGLEINVGHHMSSSINNFPVEPHPINASSMGLSDNMVNLDGPNNVLNSFGPINENKDHLLDVNEPVNPTQPQEDKELDDLFSSFNKLSQMTDNNHALKGAKRRYKGKKSKLIVGETSFAATPAPNMEDNEILDGNDIMRRIGKQIGFSFDGCNIDGGLAGFC